MTETGPTSNSGADDDGLAVADSDAAFLATLLTDLADDPDAPPSAVTPLSVIAAAKRAAAESAPVDDPKGVSPGEFGRVDPQQAPTDPRSRRRMRVFGSLLAAACLIGGALVVVPLALNNNSSVTSSSAVNTGQVVDAPSPSAAPQSLASLAEAPGEAEAGGAPVPGRADSGPAADSEGAADSGSAAGSATAGSGTLAGCWPLLDDAATASLIAAVPEVSFGRTAALADPCDPAAVAGLALSSASGVPGLQVRVTTAAEGACASAEGGCLPADGGGYLGTDLTGTPIAYAYQNGFQVAVAAPQPPAGWGLTASQALAAAQAVAAAATG